MDDGDAEFRSAPLQWVGDRLDLSVKQSGITKSGLSWFQYKESRAIGTEESANTNEKKLKRTADIAAGKIPQEDFDKAFDESPKSYYVNLLATYDGATESIRSLKEVCDEKFGDVAPNFNTLERTLEEVRQTVYILLQKKREKEPDAPVAVVEPEPEPEPEPVPTATPASAGAAAVQPLPAPACRLQPLRAALSAEPVGPQRRHCAHCGLRQIFAPAGTVQSRPVSYASRSALGRAAGGRRLHKSNSAGEAILEIRQSLKKASWNPTGPRRWRPPRRPWGWNATRMDRPATIPVRACDQLLQLLRAAPGDRFRIAGHPEDYPQILQMTLMDDTPTANAETMAWINQEVTPPPPPPPVEAAPPPPPPPPEPAYPAYQSSTPSQPGMEEPRTLSKQLMKAARSGRASEGIETLMREMTSERSGRGRFQRKSQLAQLCVSAGHQTIAFPILQDLASEIERRKLEDWEEPEMVAHPLAMLYKCLDRDAAPDDRQKLYAWICRLDPLQALNVVK